MRAVNVPVMPQHGVNLLDDPAAIKDSEVAYAKNLWFKRRGVLAKRPGMVYLDRLYTHIEDPFEPFPFSPAPVPLDFIPVAQGTKTEMMAVFRHGDTDFIHTFPLPIFNTPVGTDIGPSSLVPQIVRYGNTVFVFNGKSSGWYMKPDVVDGTGHMKVSQFEWADPAHNTVKPSLCAVVRERFWYANLGVGAEDYIIVSDRFQPEVIGAPGVDPLSIGGRAFRVGSPGEGPILAIAELSATAAGTEASTMVAVWKRDRMYLLTGEPLETDDVGDPLGDLDIIRVNTAAGCVSHRTVVTTPYGTLWAGIDDVWMMPHGGQPVRVGTKIRPALLQSPQSLVHMWHAVYDESHYKLALFSDGQGPSSMSPCGEQWWLDLRANADAGGGAQTSAEAACWMGPQQYVPSHGEPGTYCMRLDARAGYSRRAIGIHTFNMTLFDNGVGDYRILRGWSLVAFDGQDARDICAPSSPYVPWLADTVYDEGASIVESCNESDDKPYMQLYKHRDPASEGPTRPATNRPTFLWGQNAGVTAGDVWIGQMTDSYKFSTPFSVEPPLFQRDNEVLFELRTKEHTLGDPVIDKLWDGVELTYSATRNMAVRHISVIDYELNDDTVEMPSTMMAADSGNLWNALIDRRWSMSRLCPDAGKRSVGKSVQLRLMERRGIVLTESFNTVCLISGEQLVRIRLGDPGEVFDTLEHFIIRFVQAYNTHLGSQDVVLSNNGVGTYGAAVVSFTETSGVGAAILPFNKVWGAPSGPFYTHPLLGDMTGEEQAANRIFGALLGFGVNTLLGIYDFRVLVSNLDTVKGDPTPFFSYASPVEFAAVNMKLRRFNRRAKR